MQEKNTEEKLNDEIKLQNQQLLKRYLAGDHDVMLQLIELNTPLIFKIMRGYYFSSRSAAQECFCWARVGLVEAIARFDPNHPKSSFTSLAYKLIKTEICSYFRRERRTSLDVSIDAPIINEGEEVSYYDILPDKSVEGFEDALIEKYAYEQEIGYIKNLIATKLTFRQAQVIREKYFSSASETVSSEEVAKKLSCGRTNVIMQEKKAIKKIKQLVENKEVKKKFLQIDDNLEEMKSLNCALHELGVKLNVNLNEEGNLQFVKTLIGQLPDIQQDVLILRYFSSEKVLSAKSTAQKLGITRNKVYFHEGRAITNICNCIKKIENHVEKN